MKFIESSFFNENELCDNFDGNWLVSWWSVECGLFTDQKGESGVKAFPDDEASIKGEGQLLVDSFHPRRSLIVPRSIVSRLCVYVCVCYCQEGLSGAAVAISTAVDTSFQFIVQPPHLPLFNSSPFFQISLALRSNAQPSPLADQSASASFDYHFTWIDLIESHLLDKF